MVDRKIHAMHKRYGIDWENTCKGCSHLISGEWHDKRYHKCELYGISHSEASDWRRSWMACGMYNVPQDMDRWVSILDQIKHSPKSPEPPLPGASGLWLNSE